MEQMKKLQAGLITFGLLVLLAAEASLARNHSPSSGRRLRNGHWLTCWGGSDTKYRIDPPFHKNSPEEEVAEYIPNFEGKYQFEVKDTWEEWVTHHGTSCFHCGETCTGSGDNRRCSCNSCSWQELETFYRPWSVQTVTWKVRWNQDPLYRKKRIDWIKKGKPEVAHTVQNLKALLEFDPERPLEYFLFPGEVEKVIVTNGGGSWILPSVHISNPRHQYFVDSKINGRLAKTLLCDDVDLSLEATVRTGNRLITYPPNSIEFHEGWVQAKIDSHGNVVEEPGAFELTDISAQRYEQQNVFDHYKNTEVSVRLREIDRAWFFDRFVSKDLRIKDNVSILKAPEKEGDPMVGAYEINASDLYQTPLFKKPFHLHPGKNYEVCTWVKRENNIYYKQSRFWIFDAWSEANCGVFSYHPPSGYDLRSRARKVRDFFTRVTLLPWW